MFGFAVYDVMSVISTDGYMNPQLRGQTHGLKM